MMTDSQTRRSALKNIVISIYAALLLPGCDNNGHRRRIAVENLSNQLRHQTAASHLGRLALEAKPGLKSMTLEELVADILSSISLDLDSLTDEDIGIILENLPNRIRQDFTDEAVTIVDGWLLSQTEAKVCAVVYLNMAQNSANS
jgi:hypothetical protein